MSTKECITSSRVVMGDYIYSVHPMVQLLIVCGVYRFVSGGGGRLPSTRHIQLDHLKQYLCFHVQPHGLETIDTAYIALATTTGTISVIGTQLSSTPCI